jgi:hypothetical protein
MEQVNMIKSQGNNTVDKFKGRIGNILVKLQPTAHKLADGKVQHLPLPHKGNIYILFIQAHILTIQQPYPDALLHQPLHQLLLNSFMPDRDVQIHTHVYSVGTVRNVVKAF